MSVKELIEHLQEQVDKWEHNPDKQEEILESEVMISLDPGLEKYKLFRYQGEIFDLAYDDEIEKTVIVVDGEPNNDFHEDSNFTCIEHNDYGKEKCKVQCPYCEKI